MSESRCVRWAHFDILKPRCQFWDNDLISCGFSTLGQPSLCRDNKKKKAPEVLGGRSFLDFIFFLDVLEHGDCHADLHLKHISHVREKAEWSLPAVLLAGSMERLPSSLPRTFWSHLRRPQQQRWCWSHRTWTEAGGALNLIWMPLHGVCWFLCCRQGFSLLGRDYGEKEEEESFELRNKEDLTRSGRVTIHLHHTHTHTSNCRHL